MSRATDDSLVAAYKAQAECHERIRRRGRRTRITFVIALIVTLVLLLAGCAHHAQECSGLINARVTYHGARGYTAGSVVDGAVWFHPGAPYNGEPHFHLLVPCDRLREAMP